MTLNGMRKDANDVLVDAMIYSEYIYILMNASLGDLGFEPCQLLQFYIRKIQINPESGREIAKIVVDPI